MSKHAAISPGEAADRLAIRELVEAYAYCADRRDAKGQMSLFTPDTHFVVYMNAKESDALPRTALARGPRSRIRRSEQVPRHHAFRRTEHNPHSDGRQGRGETSCLAHHVTLDDGKRRLMVASLRYLDTFVKEGGAWLFAERQLFVDWLEERTLS